MHTTALGCRSEFHNRPFLTISVHSGGESNALVQMYLTDDVTVSCDPTIAEQFLHLPTF